MEKVTLPDANINYVCQLIEFLYTLEKAGKICSSGDITSYFGKTKQYTKNALYFLKFFSIIFVDKDKVRLVEGLDKEIDGSRESSYLLIKNKIVRCKPYIEYYCLIGRGKKESEASKLVNRIYNIKQEPNKINKIFTSWSKQLDINHEKKIVHTADLKKLNNSINDELMINKFLVEQFGSYYNKISKEIIDDLIEALTDYGKDPRKSINDSGRALEDFLRLHHAKSIELTKCSGIIQISNELNNHNISSKKQNGILMGLGHIRSMGDAHGIDSKEGERWKINEDTALLYTLSVIKMMVSLLEYEKGKLTL